MNMAGVSKASVASAALECKEWTITVPGMRGNMHGLVEVREEATRRFIDRKFMEKNGDRLITVS